MDAFSLWCFVVALIHVSYGSVLMQGPSKNREGKIVGGEDIEISKVPYQISLQTKGYGHSCGGAVYSKYLIITAAHCVEGTDPKRLQVRAGSSYTSFGGQTLDIESVIYHEDFSYFTMDYDVAMLKLAKPLKLGRKVASIRIVDKNFAMLDGDTATVTGWGVTEENGETARSLQIVNVPLVNFRECSDAYESFMQLTDRMMCAGFDQGGKDACQGDSGGPLVIRGRLAGVVSWGNGCARPQYPGVYTKLASLTDWIEKTAQKLQP